MIRVEMNQRLLRGGQRVRTPDLRRALREVERAGNPRKTMDVSLAFVSAREMKRLNARYRGKNSVTDVLSFETTNEILICYPQAKRQAEMMNHSVRDEIIFLFVHGLLHLLGFDHVRVQDAKRMFARQTRILKALSIDPRL